MYDELSENELKSALAQSRKNEVRTVDWPSEADMILLAEAVEQKVKKVAFTDGRVFLIAYHKNVVFVWPDNKRFPRIPCGWFDVKKLELLRLRGC